MFVFLSNMSKFFNRLSEILCITLMAIMTILVLLQIIIRYFFGFSFPWVEELVRYLMIWTTLTGSAIVLQREEHFRLTFFIDKISKKTSGIINLVLNIIILLFLILLLKTGFDSALFGKEMYTASLGIKYFFPYLSIPVMCGLMLIHQLNIIIRDTIKILSSNNSK